MANSVSRVDYIVDHPDGYFDAFGRQRVSNPTGLFDYQSQYDAGPLLWETVLTGSGTATHIGDEAAVRLRCTTASGDKVVRQTREYIRYQSGKSQLILTTFVLGAAEANVRKRVGYFDAQNGIFLEQDTDGTLYIVRRTYVSGSAVDNKVAQTDWNIQTLRGAPPVKLDVTKSAILVIDLEWLGVGRVRVGFNIDGKTIYCHEFLNANNLSTVYMTTANLPLRAEIENTDTSAANTDLIVICASVSSEGGFEESRGVPFAVCTGATAISVTAEVPILSIRPRATFNSIVNRALILPTGVDVMANSKGCVIRVKFGATLTNASWANVNTSYSAVEYDTSATAITGGICIANIFVPASSQGVNRSPGSNRTGISGRLPLSLRIDGTHPTSGDLGYTDSLTITAQTAEAPDATLIYGDIQWREIK